MDAELIEIADNLANTLLHCMASSTVWMLKAGEAIRDYQRQLPHGEMTTIYRSGRLPWGQRYCQVLAVLARNQALRDPKVLEMLPSSIAALEIIASHLDARLIKEGILTGVLHRRLTRRATLLAARKLRTQALLKNPTQALP